MILTIHKGNVSHRRCHHHRAVAAGTRACRGGRRGSRVGSRVPGLRRGGGGGAGGEQTGMFESSNQISSSCLRTICAMCSLGHLTAVCWCSHQIGDSDQSAQSAARRQMLRGLALTELRQRALRVTSGPSSPSHHRHAEAILTRPYRSLRSARKRSFLVRILCTVV